MKKQYTIKKRKNTNKKLLSKGIVFRKVVICAFLLGATMYLTWSGICDLQTTAQLRLSIQENKDKIGELEEEKEELSKTYENLSNPDYARYYAMGRYHVTQDGEQVFIFPKSEDK